MVDQVRFPPSIGGSGKIYTNDANPETGVYGGGHRINFFPMLADNLAGIGYVAKYAQDIDGAKANADRAENARGYVEAVAEAYNVNLLEQFKRHATLGLDFIEGRYWVDDGERIESSNPLDILSVSSNTPKHVTDFQKNQKEYAANTLARSFDITNQWCAVIEDVSKNISSSLVAGGNATLVDSGIAFTDAENWMLAEGATDISSPAGTRDNVKPATHENILAEQRSVYSIYYRGVDGGANELTVRYYAGDNEVTETLSVTRGKTGKIVVKAPKSSVSFTPAVRIRALGGDTKILLGGSQLEKAFSDTSYIPSPSLAVTRAADTVSYSGYSALSGATWLLESLGVSAGIVDSNRYILSASDGSTNNFIGIFAKESPGGDLTIRAFASGTSVVILSIDFTKPFKAALVFDGFTFSLFVNGIKAGSSFMTPATLSEINQLSVGSLASGNRVLKGKYKSVYSAPFQITDAYAQELTSI